MARILVQADDRKTVLLDERSVRPEHMSDEHCSTQLIERLEWAIRDELRAAKPRRRRSSNSPVYQSGLGRTFD
jgi:hypothetical protein